MGNVSDKTTFIYGLIDPRTKELRYVGKTVLKPERRLQSHIRFAKDNTRGCHSYRWLRSLAADGLKPDCFVIEEVPPLGDWTEAEQFWIAYYRFIGCRLCNVTDGGEGHSGFVPAASTIEKIKAHRQSSEHRDRMSRQSLEMWSCRRSEIVAAQNAGKGVAWREKQSLSTKEQWKQPNSKLLEATKRRQKISDHDVLEIRSALSNGASNSSLALRYGVHNSLISHIKSGCKRAA